MAEDTGMTSSGLPIYGPRQFTTLPLELSQFREGEEQGEEKGKEGEEEQSLAFGGHLYTPSQTTTLPQEFDFGSQSSHQGLFSNT